MGVEVRRALTSRGLSWGRPVYDAADALRIERGDRNGVAESKPWIPPSEWPGLSAIQASWEQSGPFPPLARTYRGLASLASTICATSAQRILCDAISLHLCSTNSKIVQHKTSVLCDTKSENCAAQIARIVRHKRAELCCTNCRTTRRTNGFGVSHNLSHKSAQSSLLRNRPMMASVSQIEAEKPTPATKQSASRGET